MKMRLGMKMKQNESYGKGRENKADQEYKRSKCSV